MNFNLLQKILIRLQRKDVWRHVLWDNWKHLTPHLQHDRYM